MTTNRKPAARKRGAKSCPIPGAAWSILRRQARRLAREVAPIYRLLNWTWQDRAVPTEAEIAGCAISLIDHMEGLVRQHGPNCGARSETGGLRCSITRGEMDWNMAIEFVISEEHHVFFPASEEPVEPVRGKRGRRP
jgi:hypothetical protein